MNTKLTKSLNNITAAYNELDGRLQTLREHIQDDIITFCDGLELPESYIDALCQIVVNRFDDFSNEE
jgi:hypothetical protein